MRHERTRYKFGASRYKLTPPKNMKPLPGQDQEQPRMSFGVRKNSQPLNIGALVAKVAPYAIGIGIVYFVLQKYVFV